MGVVKILTATAIEEQLKLERELEQKKAEQDPLSWIEEFKVSKEEVEQFEDPCWVYENLIIQSHVLALVADPAGGKTSICTFVAGEIAKRGYEVAYVLADIGKADVHHYHALAEEHGWHLLLPGMHAGINMDTVVERLETMNRSNASLDGKVFFFDTLKKMTDVIHKASIKRLMTLMRELTQKGATVVLLGHTNKYKDVDGNPVFEGTHDVKTDADDLLFLIPMKRPDGTLVVSTKPSDKVRGDYSPITFEIDKTRVVTPLGGFVDTAAQVRADRLYQDDQDEIEEIRQTIRDGSLKQSEIIAACREKRIGKRTVLRILREYSSGCYKQWNVERGFEKNTRIYHLEPESQVH
jgi:hypothetical protein